MTGVQTCALPIYDDLYQLSVLAYGDEVFDIHCKKIYDDAYNMQATGDKRHLAEVEDELLQRKRNRVNPLEDEDSFGDEWGSDISCGEAPLDLASIPM